MKQTARTRRWPIRCALACTLAAVILLAVTGFAFIRIIQGPEAILDLRDAEAGDYVAMEVPLIYGFYAEECASQEGDATAWLAFVPNGDGFATVILPERYFDSSQSVLDETYAILNGEQDSLEHYILVTGTVEELSEEAQTYLYEWFGLNMEWMQEAGLVGEVEDYADVLSIMALRVDTIGHLPAVWVYVLSSAAWLCLMVAVVIFLLWSLGKFDARPPRPEAGVGDAPAGSMPGLEELLQEENAGGASPETAEETAAPDGAGEGKADPAEAAGEAPGPEIPEKEEGEADA